MNQAAFQPIPQQDRAIRTRRAIVAAAVTCAAQNGVVSSSTARVADAAGVSQGALFRYFPQRASLWAAAVEHLLGDLFDDAVSELRVAASTDDPIAAAIAGLWRVFTDDRLFVAFELFAEARTNSALREQLAPIISAHTEREVLLAVSIFPGAGEELEAVVLGVLSTLQGAAVSSRTVMRSGAEPVELKFIEAVVRRMLGDVDFSALAGTLQDAATRQEGATL
jgi:AcrR family transcriptional regulator